MWITLPVLAPAEEILKETFESRKEATRHFSVLAPMNGEIDFKRNAMVLTEKRNIDGWPHAYAQINDDGGAPVLHTAKVKVDDGKTLLISLYVRVSNDR